MTEDFNEALLGADEADLEKLLPAKDRNDKEKEATEKIMLIESNHSKFYLGIFLLIVVDVLWVASSEISSVSCCFVTTFNFAFCSCVFIIVFLIFSICSTTCSMTNPT